MNNIKRFLAAVALAAAALSFAPAAHADSHRGDMYEDGLIEFNDWDNGYGGWA
ncbi:hypothetical protein [Streptomyces sp. C]|uniref:hypothetical protein n=1 Tax=Streptomyces sp. C TaxID=253839 RepID=UPI0001DEEE17|nr:hypothetical protein [Streptomyces sp. C]EFL13885.1 predicted protein [Streptomyces sp. C]